MNLMMTVTMIQYITDVKYLNLVNAVYMILFK